MDPSFSAKKRRSAWHEVCDLVFAGRYASTVFVLDMQTNPAYGVLTMSKRTTATLKKCDDGYELFIPRHEVPVAYLGSDKSGNAKKEGTMVLAAIGSRFGGSALAGYSVTASIVKSKQPASALAHYVTKGSAKPEGTGWEPSTVQTTDDLVDLDTL
jgi:hypothetical protein